MTSLIKIPISNVTQITSELAVDVMRALLRAECRYAGLNPNALTISSRLTVADGGLDAEVLCDPVIVIPADCLFHAGLTGFQIKSGASFKPWTESSIKSELVSKSGELLPEVRRLVERRGRYALACTGHDLTPEQRTNAKAHISNLLSGFGYADYGDLVEVMGASQLAEFIERYLGVASLIVLDPIEEGWVLDEWRHDAHMTNAFEASEEQTKVIEHIRADLLGETKHVRILGEPGLGKTRLVLEAVGEPTIAPYVLYIPHGSQFGQTKLFRRLLKSPHDTPLVLVIDELPESELAEIWRHLKSRCGQLKLISLDHGRDETHDGEIDRIQAPRLSDETIKQILTNRIGASREIDRWVEICEGSPRVAQAVAENLRANPDDLLKPPSTVPIWTRFLHSYGKRDESTARQIDCVTQHLALFSRFGYEAPVADEAIYVAGLVQKVDPTIGWARFQEIVKDLRSRRVLQGSKTLFFVPRALHIYLWRQFWQNYGNGFDFKPTFAAMPESLHAWFMSMFKYAGQAAASHVIEGILSANGLYADRATLMSAKGSRFLSTLAEANPVEVARLLEATIGEWTDSELQEFKEHRQNIVWTLEKLAVWPSLTARAIWLLARLANCENASNSNNATGTVIGLFRIGPEMAATEASPQIRLPALLKLLRSSADSERRLGLSAIAAALDTRGRGFRFVGPEYQGLKARAKLWIPKTHGEWWDALHQYFTAFVIETNSWSPHLKKELGESLLEAVNQQLAVPPCTNLAFEILERLLNDDEISPTKLNDFFWNWQEYRDTEDHEEIVKQLRSMQRRYVSRSLASRFQRYIVDLEYSEWDDDLREQRKKRRSRCKVLVNGIATRIALHPEKFDEVQHLLAPQSSSPALWHFAEQLAIHDVNRVFLPKLILLALDTKHQVCLHGYLSQVLIQDPKLYFGTLNQLLESENSAWLGATIALRSGYDDKLFVRCLDAYERGWIVGAPFANLRYGKSWQAVPLARIWQLLQHLNARNEQEAHHLLIDLLDALPFNDDAPFNSEFVFNAVTLAIPDEQGWRGIPGYNWKDVCEKLIKWDQKYALRLLDAILIEMSENYRLSYDTYVAPLATDIARADPSGSWKIVKTHFEASLPAWRSDILSWLKGGANSFHDSEPRGAVADLPTDEILKWIEVDPETRSSLISHAAPKSLDDKAGGRLTRQLLCCYGQYKGVRSGISAIFNSGGWTGLTSEYYKRRREKFREWLAAGFEPEVVQWIESELEYLDRAIERELTSEERSRFE